MRNNVLTTFPPALSLDFSIVYAKLRFDFDSFRISNANRTRTLYRTSFTPPNHQPTNQPINQPPNHHHLITIKKKKKPKNQKFKKTNSRNRISKIETDQEWEKSNYEIKRLVTFGLVRLPAAVGWGRLRRHRGVASAPRQGLEAGHCALQ